MSMETVIDIFTGNPVLSSEIRMRNIGVDMSALYNVNYVNSIKFFHFDLFCRFSNISVYMLLKHLKWLMLV